MQPSMKPRFLSPAHFGRAREFMLRSARPLDRAMFRYRFEDGSSQDVLEALAEFQLPDGGFGRAIEPDIRFPGSSPIATTIGLQTLRVLGTGAEHPVVRAAMQYLVEQYDPGQAGWAPLPREAYDHPHAPWWTQPDSSIAPSAESWGNPSAEILGYLFEHPGCVAHSLRTEVSQTALRMLEQASSPIGTYATLCYLRCTAFAPEDWRGPVLERLRSDAAQVFDPDPSKWGVDLQPFWLVPNPGPGCADSALADVLSVPVRASLDREIDRQADDGSWPPRWSWGTGDPAWEIAEREWAGEQTLRTLEALLHHGRIPKF